MRALRISALGFAVNSPRRPPPAGPSRVSRGHDHSVHPGDARRIDVPQTPGDKVSALGPSRSATASGG